MITFDIKLLRKLITQALSCLTHYVLLELPSKTNYISLLSSLKEKISTHVLIELKSTYYFSPAKYNNKVFPSIVLTF